jgi:hypothetical protein
MIDMKIGCIQIGLPAKEAAELYKWAVENI